LGALNNYASPILVIPAQAGIQWFQIVFLDAGLRRHDDEGVVFMLHYLHTAIFVQACFPYPAIFVQACFL
jgi:hypothetical protein